MLTSNAKCCYGCLHISSQGQHIHSTVGQLITWSEGPDLAALGEVLDVTVASVLAARNGSGGLLGSLLELRTFLVHAAQQAANRLWQVGCSKPTTSAAFVMADTML